MRWTNSARRWDLQSCREQGRAATEGSFGLKHHQSRGSGPTRQGKAPCTAAAEKKGCSLHLQGLRRVGTQFQEVEGEVLLPGIPSRWGSLSPSCENASEPRSGDSECRDLGRLQTQGPALQELGISAGQQCPVSFALPFVSYNQFCL